MVFVKIFLQCKYNSYFESNLPVTTAYLIKVSTIIMKFLLLPTYIHHNMEAEYDY